MRSKKTTPIKWIAIEDNLPHKEQKALIFMPRYDYVCLATYHGELSKFTDTEDEDECMYNFLQDWTLDDPDSAESPFYPISHWAEFNFPER